MAEKMVKVNLRRSVGLRGDRLYGPGNDVEVPESLARALSLKPNPEGAPAGGDVGGSGDQQKDQLDGIKFGSVAAETKAIEAGLGPSDFRDQEHSGATGFTVADVERIAAAKAAAE